MRSSIILLAAFLLICGVARAGNFDQPILSGHVYQFSGYLMIEQVAEIPYVALYRYPDGLVPPGATGRQFIPLHKGTVATNLLTLARRYGSQTRVLVQGTGVAGDALLVSVVEPDSLLDPGM